MKRFIYFALRPLSSIGRRLSRRFTKTGIFVIGSIFISAIVGLDTNQTMAYQVFIFLFGLITISVIASWLFPPPLLAMRRTVPRLGTVDVPVACRVFVRNESVRTRDGLFLIEQGPMSGNRKALFQEVALPPLAPNCEQEVDMEITPLSRGRLQLSGVSIGGTDPVGLCKSFSHSSMPHSLLVLPRRYPLPPLKLPGTRRYQKGGVSLAFSVGDSEEFISLRDYRPGDPLRHIYWKGFAKNDKPIVKEYQDEFFVRHALVLDTFQETGTDDIFEDAVSVATSFACSITTQESLLDLMFVGAEAFCFTSGRGVANTDRMLEILASVQPCRDKSFRSLLPLVLGRASALSGCICILLSWDKDRQDLVMNLKSLGIPLLALVLSTPGLQPAVDPQCADYVRIVETGRIAEGLSGL